MVSLPLTIKLKNYYSVLLNPSHFKRLILEKYCSVLTLYILFTINQSLTLKRVGVYNEVDEVGDVENI